ncbi:MAG TPA: hypothetical protein VFS21_32985 [Roseiflexaceae bacterium]|nr:hypothetical protein [Roseiflexaceae bacterium]
MQTPDAINRMPAAWFIHILVEEPALSVYTPDQTPVLPPLAGIDLAIARDALNGMRAVRERHIHEVGGEQICGHILAAWNVSLPDRIPAEARCETMVWYGADLAALADRLHLAVGQTIARRSSQGAGVPAGVPVEDTLLRPGRDLIFSLPDATVFPSVATLERLAATPERFALVLLRLERAAIPDAVRVGQPLPALLERAVSA